MKQKRTIKLWLSHDGHGHRELHTTEPKDAWCIYGSKAIDWRSKVALLLFWTCSFGKRIARALPKVARGEMCGPLKITVEWDDRNTYVSDLVETKS